MSTPTLGRLEKVDLRNAWPSESGSFTPWLAQAENLLLLGETINIELELEAQEKNVGPFRADILCRDTASEEHWVLIENQLERTDHVHLGQLLTYAAGLKAATIVWIAERFTEEHRAALDWLNEITGERFAFFGLEVELWRIGDSPMAPKFNIVSKPNDWARTVQSTASSVGEVSEVKQTQLEFWTAFKNYMEQKGSFIRCQKPGRQHWMNHSIGRSGFYLASIASTWSTEANTWEPEIRVELIMHDENAKKYFAMLEAQKEEINGAFGQPLVWHNPSEKKASKIYVRQSTDFTDAEKWPEQHEWLRANLEKMHRVFAARIKQLDASKFVPLREEAGSGEPI
ncbi:MAG: DUF4268 domain-containing protein [Acidobacteriota bacterium]|nr:DUF4268 domain-containing protein [Acidobacteriota bacterium]